MKRAVVWTLGALLLAVVASPWISAQDTPQASDEARGPRLFELRTYTTHPGKLDDLHKRFREHTNQLFKKHGMQIIGFWTPVEGDAAQNTLVYMLAYPSREARDKAWQAFGADPDWQKAFRESRQNGPLVMKVDSKFLTPTPYSPLR